MKDQTCASHLPRQPILLELLGRRHRTGDCRKQGRRGRPEEVISQINHISCTPQGSCLVAVSHRDKHLLFAEGTEETPEIGETPGQNVLNASLRHALCVEWKRSVSAENQGGASTPTAREGEKFVRDAFCRVPKNACG